MVLFGGAARMRDAMSPVQTQALLSLVDQDWDLFADTAAHAWLGWTAGESGRLVAEGFRSAAAPGVAKAWFAAAAGIDVTDRLPEVAAPTLVLHRQETSIARSARGAGPMRRPIRCAAASPDGFPSSVLPGGLDVWRSRRQDDHEHDDDAIHPARRSLPADGPGERPHRPCTGRAALLPPLGGGAPPWSQDRTGAVSARGRAGHG